MFLTFEGIDNSGKSTQCRRTLQWFQDHGQRTLLVREPGGTAVSEAVRSILLDTAHRGMAPEAELLLFSAARAQLVREIIRPELARGTVVVADRFHDSTTAYQGFGRGLSLDAIMQAHHVAIADTVPHCTIIIDIDPETSLQRSVLRGRPVDRMEEGGMEFLARVRDGYLWLADADSNRVRLIDGRRDEEAVWSDILSILRHCTERTP